MRRAATDASTLLVVVFASEDTNIVGVVQEREMRITMSSVVPMREESSGYCVKRCWSFSQEFGLEASPLVLKMLGGDCGPRAIDWSRHVHVLSWGWPSGGLSL